MNQKILYAILATISFIGFEYTWWVLVDNAQTRFQLLFYVATTFLLFFSFVYSITTLIKNNYKVPPIKHFYLILILIFISGNVLGWITKDIFYDTETPVCDVTIGYKDSDKGTVLSIRGQNCQNLQQRCKFIENCKKYFDREKKQHIIELVDFKRLGFILKNESVS